MLRQLAKRILGRSTGRRLPPLSDLPSSTNPAAGYGPASRRPSQTVGTTEQRLRAANKKSWVTSTKGWSDILGRFSSGSKD
jgi:hypothetical protein